MTMMSVSVCINSLSILSPCAECAKLIIQAGIRRVVYRDAYRLTDGIDLLKRAGVEVEQSQ